jgi:hypothetical protein
MPSSIGPCNGRSRLVTPQTPTTAAVRLRTSPASSSYTSIPLSARVPARIGCRSLSRPGRTVLVAISFRFAPGEYGPTRPEHARLPARSLSPAAAADHPEDGRRSAPAAVDDDSSLGSREKCLMIPQLTLLRARRGQTEETPAVDRASHANYIEHLQSAPSVHPGQGGKYLNLVNCPKSSTSPGTPMPPSHHSDDQDSNHAYKRRYSVKLMILQRTSPMLNQDQRAPSAQPINEVSTSTGGSLQTTNTSIHRNTRPAPPPTNVNTAHGRYQTRTMPASPLTTPCRSHRSVTVSRTSSTPAASRTSSSIGSSRAAIDDDTTASRSPGATRE